jgi:hypothetical protein
MEYGHNKKHPLSTFGLNGLAVFTASNFTTMSTPKVKKPQKVRGTETQGSAPPRQSQKDGSVLGKRSRSTVDEKNRKRKKTLPEEDPECAHPSTSDTVSGAGHQVPYENDGPKAALEKARRKAEKAQRKAAKAKHKAEKRKRKEELKGTMLSLDQGKSRSEATHTDVAGSSANATLPQPAEARPRTTIEQVMESADDLQDTDDILKAIQGITPRKQKRTPANLSNPAASAKRTMSTPKKVTKKTASVRPAEDAPHAELLYNKYRRTEELQKLSDELGKCLKTLKLSSFHRCTSKV